MMKKPLLISVGIVVSLVILDVLLILSKTPCVVPFDTSSDSSGWGCNVPSITTMEKLKLGFSMQLRTRQLYPSNPKELRKRQYQNDTNPLIGTWQGKESYYYNPQTRTFVMINTIPSNDFQKFFVQYSTDGNGCVGQISGGQFSCAQDGIFSYKVDGNAITLTPRISNTVNEWSINTNSELEIVTRNNTSPEPQQKDVYTKFR